MQNQPPRLSNIFERQMFVRISYNLKTTPAYFCIEENFLFGTFVRYNKYSKPALNLMQALLVQPLKIIIDLQVRLMRIHCRIPSDGRIFTHNVIIS